MSVDLTVLSVEEVWQLIKDCNEEIGRRRLAYLELHAKDYTGSKDAIDVHVGRERMAYSLPLPEWAAAQLAIAEDQRRLASKGCMAFYPILYPEVMDEEYTKLWPRP
jgi:hypothetical protein